MRVHKYWSPDESGGTGGELDPKPGEGGETPGEGTLPTTVEEWKTFYDTSVAESKKQIETYRGENEHLKSKLGKQSKDLDGWGAVRKAMDSSPRELITTLAERHNMKVTFGEAEPLKSESLMEAMARGGEEGQAAAKQLLAEMTKSTTGEVMRNVSPALKAMIENDLRGRYPDSWDNLATQREQLDVALQNRIITSDEVYHLAAMGKNIATVVAEADKKAFERGREEVFKEIRAKHQASLPAPGSRDTTPVTKTTKEASDQNFTKALNVLSAVHRR